MEFLLLLNILIFFIKLRFIFGNFLTKTKFKIDFPLLSPQRYHMTRYYLLIFVNQDLKQQITILLNGWGKS